MNGNEHLLIADLQSLELSEELIKAITHNRYSNLKDFLKNDVDSLQELPRMNSHLVLELLNFLLKYDLGDYVVEVSSENQS